MKSQIQSIPPKAMRQSKSKSIGRRKTSTQEQFKNQEAKRENQILLNKMLVIMNRNPQTGQVQKVNSSMQGAMPPKSNRNVRVGSSTVMQRTQLLSPTNANQQMDKSAYNSNSSLSRIQFNQKKYSVDPLKFNRKKSSTTGQVTMFKMKQNQHADRPPSVSSSARGLRKSTLSVKSAKSNASKDSRKSLSARKRKKEQNAISQENLRLVANLVNVKAMVPITSSKIYQNNLKHQSKVRESLREIRYGTPTHRSSRKYSKQAFDLRTDVGSSFNQYDSPQMAKSKLHPVEILKKRGLSNMAKMFDVG